MADTDTPPDTLAASLAALQTRLPRIRKGETAQTGQYSYRYADLADVSAELLPLLGGVGLAFTALPTRDDRGYTLVGRLLHHSGDYIEATYPLPASGRSQEIGSAITYGRRYLLCAMTGAAPDQDDDDGQAAQAARPAPQQQPATQQPQQHRPDAMTQQQSDQIGAAAAEASMTDREEIRSLASKVAGRELSSARDLTTDEATRVIDRLRDLAAEQDAVAQYEAAGAASESAAAAEAAEGAHP